MKDFNSYEPEHGDDVPAFDGDVMSTFARLAEKYEGKSGDELIAAIIKEAERSRKNGTLTDEDIDKFSAAISPMLSAKQKIMLGAVVSKIKKG